MNGKIRCISNKGKTEKNEKENDDSSFFKLYLLVSLFKIRATVLLKVINI